MTKKVYYTDKQIDGMVHDIIRQMNNDNWMPDYVVGLTRGGLVPDHWGSGEADRLWCYRVEVRETQSNMAFREGHREWNEDLLG